MDDMDMETIVAERIFATKDANIDGIIAENIGLNIKAKAEGKSELKGMAALKAALAAKEFHGTKKAQQVEKTIEKKETYSEKIARLEAEV